MAQREMKSSKSSSTTKGFSLVELLVVIALTAILAAIAAPPFMEWRENAQFRQAGRELVSFIRTARSEAVARNRQQRIQITWATRTYQLQGGNSALGSTVWGVVPTSSGVITNGRIGVAGNDTDITCNPNGSMEFAPAGGNTARITVFDTQVNAAADANSQRYRIDLQNTGRIVLNRVTPADGAP